MIPTFILTACFLAGALAVLAVVSLTLAQTSSRHQMAPLPAVAPSTADNPATWAALPGRLARQRLRPTVPLCSSWRAIVPATTASNAYVSVFNRHVAEIHHTGWLNACTWRYQSQMKGVLSLTRG